MDVQEVRKLDAYLKKLFGNTNLRVVPKTYDTANIFVGEDEVGELNLDDEDGDRSFNSPMKSPAKSAPGVSTPTRTPSSARCAKTSTCNSCGGPVFYSSAPAAPGA